MSDRYIPLERYLLEQNIQYRWNVPMKEHTSFHIGGNCDIMLFPKTEEQLQQILFRCHSHEIPTFILGKGSNVLASDYGYRGAVISMTKEMTDIQLMDETVLVCQAGANLAAVCMFALDHGLSGLEFAYGIPGSVGGAAFMNAGAYGGEMKDVVFRCDHVTEEGTSGHLQGNDLDFSYRHSAYEENHFCITKVYVRLKKGDPEQIRETMNDLLNRRKSKQPLEYPSAGSTFKRPDGAYASALIEQCGLKGFSVGDAQVSEKHSGFVINTGNATCADVLELIDEIQCKVYECTGYYLECEVRKIGE